MKLTPILILALFLTGSLTAQTEKGKFLLNGSVGININHRLNPDINTAEHKTFNLSIAPVAGYFFEDDLAIGLQLNYQYSNDKILRRTNTGLETFSNTLHRIGGGPFIKWYVPIVDRISYFTQANVALHSYGNEDFQISAAIKPGLTLFITPKIGIELSTNLLTYDYRKLLNSNYNNLFFGLNLNNSQLGISFYL